MLEMMLKLAQKCDRYSYCDDCPLYDLESPCGVDAIEIEDVKQTLKALTECETYKEVYPSDFGLAIDEIPDNVNHPKHYETGKFECIDVMIETQGVEAVKNFCICNAFKYIYRHKNKNGCEDVKKAIWYLNKFVELDGGQNENQC